MGKRKKSFAELSEIAKRAARTRKLRQAGFKAARTKRYRAAARKASETRKRNRANAAQEVPQEGLSFSIDFFRDAGKRGGTITKTKYGKEYYSAIGKKGGRPRKGNKPTEGR